MDSARIDLIGGWALKNLGRDPFGLQFQVARTVLALGTFLTLAFNPAAILFHSGSLMNPYTVNCPDVGAVGLFCIVSGDSLDAARLWLAIACLPAILGIVPAVSSWLHAYAAFSLSNNAIGIEGGDQLTVNLAILLAVASMSDSRWFGYVEDRSPGTLVRFIVPNVLLCVCVIQIAYVYVEAALVKLGHPIWAEGSALWYWVQNSGFGVSRDSERLLLDLLAVPLVSAAASWGTIILEMVIASLLIFGRRNQGLRRSALVIGICFHAAIALLMGLVTFFVAMTGALILGCWYARDGYSVRLYRRLRRRVRKVSPLSKEGVTHAG
jgi:antimicrobial peptide system SdpB family protein